jgi:hypothetical protein
MPKTEAKSVPFRKGASKKANGLLILALSVSALVARCRARLSSLKDMLHEATALVAWQLDSIKLDIFFETAHQEACCISQRLFVKRGTQNRKENHWTQLEMA